MILRNSRFEFLHQVSLERLTNVVESSIQKASIVFLG